MSTKDNFILSINRRKHIFLVPSRIIQLLFKKSVSKLVDAKSNEKRIVLLDILSTFRLGSSYKEKLTNVSGVKQFKTLDLHV